MGFEMLHHSGKIFKDSKIKLDLRNSTENAHHKIFWRQGNSKPVLSKLDKKSNFHVVYIFINYVVSFCFYVSWSRCVKYTVYPLLLCQINGKKKSTKIHYVSNVPLSSNYKEIYYKSFDQIVASASFVWLQKVFLCQTLLHRDFGICASLKPQAILQVGICNNSKACTSGKILISCNR